MPKNSTLLTSILASRRAGLLRLRPVQGPVRLECLGERCGRCCQAMGSGIHITTQDLVQLTKVNALAEKCSLKTNGRACALLQSNTCSIYEHRPRSCREYPFYNLGGKLYYDSGCPGIQRDRAEEPDAGQLTPIEEYLRPLPRVLRPAVVRLFTMW
jgi:Fe-S-cluster containining protein